MEAGGVENDKPRDAVIAEAVVESSHGSSNSKRSQTWGRGIVDDFKSTVGTWWCKEMSNLNGKTIAVSFFLYFACMSPAIVSNHASNSGHPCMYL